MHCRCPSVADTSLIATKNTTLFYFYKIIQKDINQKIWSFNFVTCFSDHEELFFDPFSPISFFLKNKV